MLAGQYVASPALGTAGVLIKRIAYGLSLPGLVSVAVIYCHLSCAYFPLITLAWTLRPSRLQWKIPLCTPPARKPSSEPPDCDALDHVDRLRPRKRPILVHHRLRDSRIQRACLPGCVPLCSLFRDSLLSSLCPASPRSSLSALSLLTHSFAVQTVGAMFGTPYCTSIIVRSCFSLRSCLSSAWLTGATLPSRFSGSLIIGPCATTPLATPSRTRFALLFKSSSSSPASSSQLAGHTAPLSTSSARTATAEGGRGRARTTQARFERVGGGLRHVLFAPCHDFVPFLVLGFAMFPVFFCASDCN